MKFATVEEGFIDRHLTFVPVGGMTVGPDELKVTISRELLKTAPNIEQQGQELSQAGESAQLTVMDNGLVLVVWV
ncbi:MAG TPA: hypothetical protein VMU64_14520 [Acidimicrobiales bacterium]|nr:hypothetical protein [Acidimicrobiales bacterium]